MSGTVEDWDGCAHCTGTPNPSLTCWQFCPRRDGITGEATEK